MRGATSHAEAEPDQEDNVIRTIDRRLIVRFLSVFEEVSPSAIVHLGFNGGTLGLFYRLSCFNSLTCRLFVFGSHVGSMNMQRNAI